MNQLPSSLDNQRVVQANDLISSVAKMDNIPLKIFELAVAQIQIDKPPKDNVVTLSKHLLFTFFSVNDSNKHNRFKKAIEKMQKQAYFLIEKKAGKGHNFESIVPIPYVNWNDYDDNVSVEFNHRIMPYIVELKEKFTQYAIKDIMYLDSKYSVTLYKIFSMNYNQFENYEHTLNRTKQQLDGYKNPTFSIEELRRITDTEESYQDFRNFDKRVLKQSLEQINQYTNFNVTYEKIKYGRSVQAVQFFIQKKKVADNPFYKDEQQDVAYLENKESKEHKKKDDFLEVQKNLYTSMLLTNKLLDFSDVLLDMDLMLNLAHSVYGLYDELVELAGVEQLTLHLAYVYDKKLDYTKENKVKYLRKSIENYLKTIKIR